jgi:hypothetical protein
MELGTTWKQYGKERKTLQKRAPATAGKRKRKKVVKNMPNKKVRRIRDKGRQKISSDRVVAQGENICYGQRGDYHG